MGKGFPVASLLEPQLPVLVAGPFQAGFEFQGALQLFLGFGPPAQSQVRLGQHDHRAGIQGL